MTWKLDVRPENPVLRLTTKLAKEVMGTACDRSKAISSPMEATVPLSRTSSR
jgi:hypothetical protein